MVLSSILIYLSCRKHWEATDEGKNGEDEKKFFPSYEDILIICWELFNLIWINA